jgi:polyisoprenoid-binding protein YceI
MPVVGGPYRLTPESGELLVKTSRTGMGRRAGHDLVIEATRWQGDVTAAAEPLGIVVSVVVDVDSLEVREGLGGVKPLTGKDRVDIRKNLRDVLDGETHPQIAFSSTRVTRSDASVTVEGNLTIRGETQSVSLRCQLTDDRVRGSATVEQTRWGVRPYSAVLGALKLADEVRVEFNVALVPDGGDSGAGRS